MSKLDKVLSKTQGRFFGLQTKNGEVINAKAVSVTPHYVTIHDNNAKVDRKFNKTSLSAITVGGRRYRV